MNLISFIVKFIKFKPIIKFKKFERHNYAISITECKYSSISIKKITRTQRLQNTQFPLKRLEKHAEYRNMS